MSTNVDFATLEGVRIYGRFDIELLRGNLQELMSEVGAEVPDWYDPGVVLGVKIVEVSRWMLVRMPYDDLRGELIEALVVASMRAATQEHLYAPELCKLCAMAILKQDGEQVVREMLRLNDEDEPVSRKFSSSALRQVLMSLVHTRTDQGVSLP